jgi:hypothetical protein
MVNKGDGVRTAVPFSALYIGPVGDFDTHLNL